MFKASIQRHVRLGNVTRRQLSILSPLRGARIQTLEQQSCGRTVVPLSSQLAVARHTFPRFYSYESASRRDDVDVEADSESAPSTSNGLTTRFADLKKLGVHPALVSAITEGMGYEKMTDVQSLTINAALNGVDLVAQAKTGTGKTLAFLVPLLQRLLAAQPDLAERFARRHASSDNVQAIIMSPTRELAEQIGVEAKKLVQNTGIVVQTAVGGTRKRESLFKMQREGCHILVATPGRLNDLLSDPQAGVAAPNLQAFVLDEADRMLDVGFSDAIRDILDLLPSQKEVDRQTLLFSATIPKNVVHLAKSLVKTDNFEFVQTIKHDEAPTHEKIPQHVVACNGYENWLPAVMEIVEKGQERARADPSALPFKAIVFFSNTATVEFVNTVLQNTSLGGVGGIPIYDIHSKLTQGQRTRSAEAFRRAKTGILISSDVTARGMDFPNVSHVIQIGLPPDRDQYIHRIGRTGRAGSSGEGWLLLAEEEISEARVRLPGLPIRPNHDLETAKHQLGDQQPSANVERYFSDVARGYEKSPRWEFAAVYSSLLGQKFGRNLRVDDTVVLLNNWASKGLGWSEPPAISARSAANRGLGRIRGIRVGQEEERPVDDRDRFGGRGGFGGGRDSRGGRGGSGGRGGDRFDSFFPRSGDRDGGRGGYGRDRNDGNSFRKSTF